MTRAGKRICMHPLDTSPQGRPAGAPHGHRIRHNIEDAWKMNKISPAALEGHFLQATNSTGASASKRRISLAETSLTSRPSSLRQRSCEVHGEGRAGRGRALTRTVCMWRRRQRVRACMHACRRPGGAGRGGRVHASKLLKIISLPCVGGNIDSKPMTMSEG